MPFIWLLPAFRYSGDWFEGERAGFGTWTGPTGDEYQGEYKRDKRNGVGCYQFAQGASGATYEGTSDKHLIFREPRTKVCLSDLDLGSTTHSLTNSMLLRRF